MLYWLCGRRLEMRRYTLEVCSRSRVVISQVGGIPKELESIVTPGKHVGGNAWGHRVRASGGP